ncbi:MAG: alpha/beta hydrolase [Candidatus Saccharimonadales bacterium]
MKRAVILHGTDGTPTGLPWQGWLQRRLGQAGYEVFFPQLPECHTPDLSAYDTFLRQSGWDFSDNIVIGHSSGATTLLHLLASDWFPKIKAAVLVGTFLNERLLKEVKWYEPGQFDALFIETITPEKIKQGAKAFYFVHGDDDPYCDYAEAKQLYREVDGTFITITGGGHISTSPKFEKLTQLTEVLRRDGLL